MASRIGWSAAGVSFATGAVLALFEVQGWKMWPWLAVTLLIVLIAAGAVFGVVLLLSLWEAVRGWRLNYSARWPIFRTDALDPNQWLLDIAKEDAENPARFLLITDTVLTPDTDLSTDLERPYIGLGVELLNCNVHTIAVGGVSGHARFNGKELREAISDAGGQSNKPRGHSHVYRMKQYLSPEQAAQIQEEREEETKVRGGQRRKEVRSLDLSGVTIEVESEGHVTSFGLNGVQSFRYD